MPNTIITEIKFPELPRLYPLWYISESESHPIEWTTQGEEAFNAGTKMQPNPHPGEYKYWKYGTEFQTTEF
jgi:hypothetical protein